MSPWLIAASVLLVALVPCAAVCFRGSRLAGLAALEVAGTVVTAIFVLVAAGVHREPFLELALVAAVLTFAGSLCFARLLEEGL